MTVLTLPLPKYFTATVIRTGHLNEVFTNNDDGNLQFLLFYLCPPEYHFKNERTKASKIVISYIFSLTHLPMVLKTNKMK